MIAPEANDGKGLHAAPDPTRIDHGFVSEIILLPNFGQAAAKLRGKIATVVVTSGPVSKSTGFLSPPAPRGLERPGRLFRVRFNPPTLRAGFIAGPFFVMSRRYIPPWFETRSFAALLTMRSEIFVGPRIHASS
jgi:hypothetical protein